MNAMFGMNSGLFVVAFVFAFLILAAALMVVGSLLLGAGEEPKPDDRSDTGDHVG
jgi:uncharacterized membrane protein